MRENLLDLLERLASVHDSLGPETFNLACHRAKLAVARVAMEAATDNAHLRAHPSTRLSIGTESEH